ncbi:DUF2933 domain-containing protein [Azohydromonas lata]|uniref:DUF2933 domain-containing protein n=2 Tax=Azohydromonas lata TaxID=45677 RepID=A0ABU5I954_9BURK|nr:DUF2933 domain-containing protein [Azohydromonas lata]MDZ5455635.1 DUF2933 domain-containing protein [Azohydromonas lata]
MDTSHRHDMSGAGQGSGPQRRPWNAVIVMLLLIGGFYLLREHWGHVAGLWPYLLLLGCPLMHLFGHGHGGHGHHHGGSNSRNGSSPDGKW